MDVVHIHFIHSSTCCNLFNIYGIIYLDKTTKQFSVSSLYNDYKENGEYVYLELDLVAELRTDIHALCEGTVVETGFDLKIGNYIVINHGNGQTAVKY